LGTVPLLDIHFSFLCIFSVPPTIFEDAKIKSIDDEINVPQNAANSRMLCLYPLKKN
jgi:hypothetical protein